MQHRRRSSWLLLVVLSVSAQLAVSRGLLPIPVAEVPGQSLLVTEAARRGRHARSLQQEQVAAENQTDYTSQCMDLVGLKAAVDKAAWQRTASSQPPLFMASGASQSLPNDDLGPQADARVVILSMCDLVCLENLFDMWMGSIRSAEGGDNAPHVVLVALGEAAMEYCVKQQANHPHQCVLDRSCGTQNRQEQAPWHHPRRRKPHAEHWHSGSREGPSFLRGKRRYLIDGEGHGQDPTRSMEVQQTRPQLKVFTPEGPHTGMSFATNSYFLALQQKLMWARQVLALNVSVLWLDVDILVYKALLPRLVLGPELSHADLAIAGESCDERYQQEEEALKFRKHEQFHQNGGLWLMHATYAGKGLMDVWAGENWKAIMVGTHRRLRPLLDQDVLNKIIIQRIVKTTAIMMTKDGQYTWALNKMGGDIEWTRHKWVKAYKLSIQKYQNQNGGWCGCPPTWKRDDNLVQRNPYTNGIVCQVSQAHVNQWVTMHLNGLKGIHQKVARMASLRNITGLGALP